MFMFCNIPLSSRYLHCGPGGGDLYKVFYYVAELVRAEKELSDWF